MARRWKSTHARLTGLIGLLVGAAAMAWAAPAPAAGNFTASCLYSHSLEDDPITAPGQPGASHRHDFLGNISTSAFSTLVSLRAAPTRCSRPEDHSAYWLPTLVVGGREVHPSTASVYYVSRAAGTRKGPRIRPLPAGLAMIAGDPGARSPQPTRVVRWRCSSRLQPDPHRPRCLVGTLRLDVSFPDCWDGRRLDSADHKSHMAYARPAAGHGARCPATHPMPVPQLTLYVNYPTAGAPDAELSSGGQLGAHADFLNAWDDAAQLMLVDQCLTAGVTCFSTGP